MQQQDLVYSNIINKSALLFNTYGVRRITMDEISSECGISKKTLYHFFENKEELVGSVISDELELLRADIARIRSESKDAIDEQLQWQSVTDRLIKRIQPSLINDLKKYYQTANALVEDFKNNLLYDFFLSNIERGIGEGLYLSGFNNGIMAKIRIMQLESIVHKVVYLEAGLDVAEVSRQLNCHFLSGITSVKGFKVLEKHIHAYYHN